MTNQGLFLLVWFVRVANAAFGDVFGDIFVHTRPIKGFPGSS